MKYSRKFSNIKKLSIFTYLDKRKKSTTVKLIDKNIFTYNDRVTSFNIPYTDSYEGNESNRTS